MKIIPEISLLKVFLDFDVFKQYSKTINLVYLKETFKELAEIYSSLFQLFNKYPKTTTIEELQVFFYTIHPGIDNKQRGIYDGIFQQVAHSEVRTLSLLDLVKSIRQRENYQAIAVKAFEASEGRGTAEEVSALTKQLLESDKHPENSQVQFVSDNLNDLYIEAVKTPGLRWRLSSLNSSLGSLRRGDFGFLFARPETGKTTLLASEISFMASQVDTPILWFNNEEQGAKVMLRCYQAVLGLRLEQLISDLKGNHQKFLKLTKGLIKIYDQAIISKNDVEAIVSGLTPSLIIFDQIDKISGFKADRNDLELGDIYNWARELAKTYCPVIGVCQSDGTGEGQKWLTMSNVANAKTSKQAEADWILGIGRSNEEGYESVRHFNISKNKLIGDKDTLSENRHAKWDVKIEPEIARYEDFNANLKTN